MKRCTSWTLGCLYIIQLRGAHGEGEVRQPLATQGARYGSEAILGVPAPAKCSLMNEPT